MKRILLSVGLLVGCATIASAMDGFSYSGVVGGVKKESRGGGSSAARVTVGTSSVQGVDVVSTNEEGFRAAIDSVTASGGGQIVVREGVYSLSGPVTVPENVTIVADRGAIIQRAVGGTDTVLVIRGRWTGGTFNATGSADGLGFIALEGESAELDNFVLTGEARTDDTRFAFVLVTGNNALIRNGLITNCNIVGGSGAIFRTDGVAKNTQFIGNRVINNASDGGNAVLLLASEGSFSAVGNLFSGNTGFGASIIIHRANAAMLGSNTFDLTADPLKPAILMQAQSDGAICTHVMVKSNVFKDGTNPITIQTNDTPGFAHNNIISDNCFFEPKGAAVKISRNATGTADNTYLHGNTVGGPLLEEDAGSVNTIRRDNASGDGDE